MKLETVILIGLVAVLTGCASKQAVVEESMDVPINCKTAEGDLRALQSEKQHVTDQVAAGVQAIVPFSAIAHMVQGTEDTQLRVMTGEYDEALDKRIAQIKTECGIK